MTLQDSQGKKSVLDEAHTARPVAPSSPLHAPQANSDNLLVVPPQALPGEKSANSNQQAAGGATSTPMLHVNRDTLELVTGQRSEVVPTQEVRATRDLNVVVHQVLIVGLLISVTFLLVGLGLGLFLHREIPTIIASPTEAFRRALALRPSGFLALGVIVLVATPIVRVVGSLLVFLYERDWRYAVATSIVLIITIISIRTGAG